ncbi:MAG: 23S rRNA (adenine(2503)-C(2))-methyltransferase RlmN [Bacillota bacterium]|nr:23S rRNA (adenine(2503)-C(2))-methyltransferase RlmN [Bacillota bacterium]
MEHKENQKKTICDFTLDQLVSELEQKNIPGFRAKQIFNWVYDKGVTEFNQMTNLSQQLQFQLAESYQIMPIAISKKQTSSDGTTKLLYKLNDDEAVESVLMTYGDLSNPERITVCVSTQVGCGMGCSFCATGLGGYKRNLSEGEILGQILGFQQALKEIDNSFRVSNVVYMGMGEPLLNYDNVVKSIRMLNAKEIFNISYRRITVSTCGLVPQIRSLAHEDLPIVLAISLHATTDSLRNQLMPINKKYPLDQLIEACRYYFNQTGRKLTFEYIMLDNINDYYADAERLALLTKGFSVNVNLIPFNQVNESGFKRSDRNRVNKFAGYLKQQGVETVIREEKGGDILAACGQLRQAQQYNRGDI